MPGPWAETWVSLPLSVALNPTAPTLLEGQVDVMAVDGTTGVLGCLRMGVVVVVVESG